MKKIKFGLEVAYGNKVRTIEDLRIHFDIEKIIGHFHSGKLLEWLKDRHYDEIAQDIEPLDDNDEKLEEKLCLFLGVEYSKSNISSGDIKIINKKKLKLKQLTTDKKIIDNARITAFDQEDLAYLLDAREKTIYLCGDEFHIPITMKDMEYIGILGTPTAYLIVDSIETLNDLNIRLSNITLQQELSITHNSQTQSLQNKNFIYRTSDYFNLCIDDKDIEKTRLLFNEARRILQNVSLKL